MKLEASKFYLPRSRVNSKMASQRKTFSSDFILDNILRWDSDCSENGDSVAESVSNYSDQLSGVDSDSSACVSSVSVSESDSEIFSYSTSTTTSSRFTIVPRGRGRKRGSSVRVVNKKPRCASNVRPSSVDTESDWVDIIITDSTNDIDSPDLTFTFCPAKIPGVQDHVNTTTELDSLHGKLTPEIIDYLIYLSIIIYISIIIIDLIYLIIIIIDLIYLIIIIYLIYLIIIIYLIYLTIIIYLIYLIIIIYHIYLIIIYSIKACLHHSTGAWCRDPVVSMLFTSVTLLYYIYTLFCLTAPQSVMYNTLTLSYNNM